MLLKLIFCSLLIFKTINATAVPEENEDSSFSVEKIWKSYQTPGTTITCSEYEEYEEWSEGIQEYYDGCKVATSHFLGPSYKIANNAMDALEALFIKLIYFSTTNSTVLAPNSVLILEALSSCRKCDQSGLNIIREFKKVQLNIMRDFEEIVNNLEEYIGDLTCSFNDALSDLGYTFSTYMTKFLLSGLTNFKTKVDYEPTLKKFQKLMNTVSLITETLLNECKNPTPELEESVTTLNTLYAYYLIVVQGVYACALDTLYRQKCEVSPRLAKCSVSMDYVVVEVTQSIISIVTPFSETIRTALKNIVNITKAFNKLVEDVLGLFEGVTIKVGNILHELTKGSTASVGTQGRGLLQGLNLK